MKNNKKRPAEREARRARPGLLLQPGRDLSGKIGAIIYPRSEKSKRGCKIGAV